MTKPCSFVSESIVLVEPLVGDAYRAKLVTQYGRDAASGLIPVSSRYVDTSNVPITIGKDDKLFTLSAGQPVAAQSACTITTEQDVCFDGNITARMVTEYQVTFSGPDEVLLVHTTRYVDANNDVIDPTGSVIVYGACETPGESSEITTRSLDLQVHKGGFYTGAQANNGGNVADIWLLSDGTRLESGRVKYPAHGLTVGSYYFTSQTTAGEITDIEPTSGWHQRVLFVEDADTLHLQVEPAQDLSSTAPTISRYVGGTSGDPTVSIGNFEVRYQSATNNLQIRTLTGTASINFYSEAWFSSGSNASTSGKNFAVTTTFVNFTDPGVLFDAEQRTIRFTAVAVSDPQAYLLTYNGWDNGATDKIILRLEPL